MVFHVLIIIIINYKLHLCAKLFYLMIFKEKKYLVTIRSNMAKIHIEIYL